MQGSNAELRDRLHEVSAQAQASQAEVEALQGLQSSLRNSAGPSVDALVEAAVARERALQDARNKKVLELLNNKVTHCPHGLLTDWAGCCTLGGCTQSLCMLTLHSEHASRTYALSVRVWGHTSIPVQLVMYLLLALRSCHCVLGEAFSWSSDRQ